MKNQAQLRLRTYLVASTVFCLVSLLFLSGATAQSPSRWKAHDLNRPLPRVVTPAPQDAMVPPPSDAVVLFDGTDLSRWCNEDGEATTWKAEDGVMVCPGTGDDIFTVQPFGDVQLHMEWSTPSPPAGSSQGRGNSGVFLMELYEVQILDSYGNTTYADGQAAALYGQYPPLVNACLPPGAWQTYDIIFRRPRFHTDGTLLKPARMTVLQNGVLVQDSAELWGPTMWLQHMPYRFHPDRLPISLQDHGNPVRFRNIWVRELREQEEPGPSTVDTEPGMALGPEALDRYTGTYKYRPDSESDYTVVREGRQLHCIFGKKRARVDLVQNSLTKFSMRWTAGHVEFDLDDEGCATAMTVYLEGSSFKLRKMD